MTWVARLTWAAVERKLAGGVPAILPIGAAAKQHGLHLPMNTDQIQAEWLAERLANSIDGLIWPPVLYGYYPAFRAFSGSVSISRSTFVALLSETIIEILRWKPQRLYIIDTGISTIESVDETIARVGSSKVEHLRIYEGRRYSALAKSISEQTFGSHADELETSRMLAIAPAQVEMAHADATPDGPFDGPLTHLNAPAGTYGNPRLATFEKGQALLDAILADMLETCR